MNEYQKQANDFLKSTGSTIEARYLKYDVHFPNDEQKRDIWEIRLKKGSREYVFPFGASVNDHEEMLKKYFPNCPAKYAQKCLDEGKLLYDGSMYHKIKTYNNNIESLKEWKEAGSGERPTTYSVLACLHGYEPENNIDDFASEFGYTKPSEAIRVFEAVKDEYNNLKLLYNDKELEMLQEIN